MTTAKTSNKAEDKKAEDKKADGSELLPVDPTEDQLVNDETASVDWDGSDEFAFMNDEDFDDDDYPEVRTSDSDDPGKSWTVQDVDDEDSPVVMAAPEDKPGQVFSKSELPDVEAMKKAGINPAQYLSGLPVSK